MQLPILHMFQGTFLLDMVQMIMIGTYFKHTIDNTVSAIQTCSRRHYKLLSIISEKIESIYF